MALLTQQKLGEGELVAIPREMLTHIAAGRVKYEAADVGGDTFNNAGRTFLHVKNGSGVPLTVTVAAKPTKTDREATVSAGGEVFMGIFPLTDFNVNASITYSVVTSLTIAALTI